MVILLMRWWPSYLLIQVPQGPTSPLGLREAGDSSLIWWFFISFPIAMVFSVWTTWASVVKFLDTVDFKDHCLVCWDNGERFQQVSTLFLSDEKTQKWKKYSGKRAGGWLEEAARSELPRRGLGQSRWRAPVGCAVCSWWLWTGVHAGVVLVRQLPLNSFLLLWVTPIQLIVSPSCTLVVSILCSVVSSLSGVSGQACGIFPRKGHRSVVAKELEWFAHARRPYGSSRIKSLAILSWGLCSATPTTGVFYRPL